MAESPGARANQAIGIDLRQFHQVFFEEAGENLEALEQRLLGMDLQSADDEALNAIFRCAHSVKGGAAAFGFQDVTELTHEMETLLDKLRRHELAPAPRMVDLLLTAGDVLKAQLAYHQGSTKAAPDTTNLLSQIRDCCGGAAAPAPAPALTPDRAPAPPSSPQAAATAADLKGLRLLELSVNITADPSLADSLVELFQEISDLGQIEPLDGGRAADGLRRFKVSTSSSDSDLMDLFSFHASADAIGLRPLGSGYGFYNGAPGAPMKEAATSPQLEHRAAVVAAPAAAPRSESLPESATLRVAVDKVDQLINLVGELVITQAMLAQRAKDEGRAMSAGLADLERNTRDLQTAVMSIRMMPMSLVFNRFPRMLRDLAARLDKRVELVTLGESTELDKGMVEKIIDPLNHLLRNSCDHGIELPAERLAKGKPAQGRLTLAASHQGGSILIEVRDDGRGLNRDTLLRKARKQGLCTGQPERQRGLEPDLCARLLYRRGAQRCLGPRCRHGRGEEEHQCAGWHGRDRFGRGPGHERQGAAAADAGHHRRHDRVGGRRLLHPAAGFGDRVLAGSARHDQDPGRQHPPGGGARRLPAGDRPATALSGAPG